jgi:hypothetical protein
MFAYLFAFLGNEMKYMESTRKGMFDFERFDPHEMVQFIFSVCFL